MIAYTRHASILAAVLFAGFAALPTGSAVAGNIHTDHTPPVHIDPPKVVRDHRGDNSGVTYIRTQLPTCISLSRLCRTTPPHPTKGTSSGGLIIRDHR
jgi:hypothetical protein